MVKVTISRDPITLTSNKYYLLIISLLLRNSSARLLMGISKSSTTIIKTKPQFKGRISVLSISTYMEEAANNHQFNNRDNFLRFLL